MLAAPLAAAMPAPLMRLEVKQEDVADMEDDCRMQPVARPAGPDLRTVVVTILPFRTEEYRSELCRKLEAEGIQDPVALKAFSQEALMTMLAAGRTSEQFSLGETADVVSIAKFVAKAPRSHPANGRSTKSRRRERSRSRSPSPQDGRGRWRGRGHRAGSRPLRGGCGRRGSSHNSRGRGPSPAKPALWAAVEAGDEDRVCQLLKEGANPSETYKSWTPLMKAAEENRTQILSLLLDRGASINAANSKGRSALSFAAAPSMQRATSIDTLRFLLEHGADAGQRDANGLTPKDRAERERRADALEVLAHHGIV